MAPSPLDAVDSSGEPFVVSVGAEHQPVADDEATLLRLAPTGTPNTGDIETAAPRIAI